MPTDEGFVSIAIDYECNQRIQVRARGGNRGGVFESLAEAVVLFGEGDTAAGEDCGIG